MLRAADVAAATTLVADTAAARSRSRSPRGDKDREEDEADVERQLRRDRKKTPHFVWERGLVLGPGDRYTVTGKIGEGTFGRVLSCEDRVTKGSVAIKVVKGVKRYCEDAEIEAEVLREIQKNDPNGTSGCVRLLDTFLHSDLHFCLVFEKLDISFRDLLKRNGGNGLLLRDIVAVARQFLKCLAFIHSIGIVHTDLKCRNLMLRDGSCDVMPFPRATKPDTTVRSPCRCEIRVIDFGGACFQHEVHDGRIGTRQYRAPEVVLGLNWNEKSDLWSAGCILAMLYTGSRPFQVHEDMEHLALIERVTGLTIPPVMVRVARVEGSLPDDVNFDDEGRLVWPGDADEEAIEHVSDTVQLREQVLPHHNAFSELLSGLFEIDPAKRLSAVKALRTPLLREGAVMPPEGLS
eukprot:TRINITY_DN20488_c0_g1_i1.p1 TRINITY_DN20488_c0_g1~~TRINITY_DN20488_c0_g1_i1.p1  ORF type:complete len:406 (+),score=77.96 TRINITY_DN20488_c0_g1_i1:219-1436(+)